MGLKERGSIDSDDGIGNSIFDGVLEVGSAVGALVGLEVVGNSVGVLVGIMADLVFIVSMFVIGTIFIILFVIRELRMKAPMLSLEVLKYPIKLMIFPLEIIYFNRFVCAKGIKLFTSISI